MYVTESYLQSVFGAAFVAAMSPSASELATAIELGDAAVASALSIAGYSTATPASVYTDVADVPPSIKLAAVGAWWMFAHTTRGIGIPEPVPGNLKAFVDALLALQAGTLVVPELPRSTSRGPAGVLFTESDPDVTGSRPAIFGRESMGEY